MYTKAKYVVLDSCDTVIAFPEWVQHSEIFPAARKVSAGFFYVEDGKVIAFGESISLSLQSRGELDAKLIAKQLNIS